MVDGTLVIGGGLAGAATALWLARTGERVRVAERAAGPHDKVCGEFLSVEAVRELGALGIDVAALGAHPIDRVRLVRGRSEAEAELPFVAQGLSRRVLDEVLLEAAARAGAQVQRGTRIASLDAASGEAHRVVLATGKHDLRGAPRAPPSGGRDWLGFKMHYRAPPALRSALSGTIELVLFEGGYAGVQLVAADTMNLCLAIRRDAFARVGGEWPGLREFLMREPGIARRLVDAEPLFAAPLAVAQLPYGYLCDPAERLPGKTYRVGDQAAMTASLTGDGMAGALRGARLLADCLAAGASPVQVARRQRDLLGRQVYRAMTLQRAAENPALGALGMGAARLFPRLLGWAAAATRLPD